MKNILKAEEVGMLALAAYLLSQLDVQLNWWLWLVLFLSPDIGIAGYLVNPRVGAMTYNLCHHRGIASAVLILGIYQSNNYVMLAGLLLFAHSSFDRVLGYGLKYSDNFKHTSIGDL